MHNKVAVTSVIVGGRNLVEVEVEVRNRWNQLGRCKLMQIHVLQRRKKITEIRQW